MTIPLLSSSVRMRLKVFIPAVIILIVALGTYFILIPQMNTTRDRWRQMVETKHEAVILTQKARILSSIEKESLRKDLRTVDRVLPTDNDVAVLLNVIEGLAQSSGTQISALAIHPVLSHEVQADENGQTLQFTISLFGTKHSIESAIGLTDNAAPLLSLSSVQIEYTSSGLARVQLEIYMHYYPLPKMLGEIDKPLPSFSSIQQEELSRLEQFRSYTSVDIETKEASASPLRQNLFKL